MKYTKSAILLFFSVLIQASFLRLIAGIPFLPDMPLIILFILSYYLPRFGFFVLAVLTGAMIDLFSAVHFGSSAIALVSAFIVCHIAREYIFKGKNFSNAILCSSTFFLFFYVFLFFSNRVLGFFGGNNFTFSLFDKKLMLEFALSAICAAGLIFFLEGKIDHVNIHKHKRFFKISD